jgi:protein-tyrosine phosphatase
VALDIFPIDGPWPGKLAICACPRSGAWLDGDIGSLRESGIDLLVTAITSEELAKLHLGELAACCFRQSISHVHFPIGNLKAPPLERATPLLEAWKHQLNAGRGVAMHCFASVGRSPTLAAALLVMSGVRPAEAWSRVERARGREVPDTLEQRRWVEALVPKVMP